MIRNPVREIRLAISGKQLNGYLLSSMGHVKCRYGAKKNEPIRVGLATTLTGPASTAGVRTRNGAILAIEQANSSGGINGRQVEVLIKDDRGVLR